MRPFYSIGNYLLMLKGMFRRPENGRMFWKEFMHQSVEIGFGSLGIVAIISIFMGAVSAIQTAYQITSPLISNDIIATVVRDTVILEFAPTLVCIVLAGVVGSKIASELGNMRVSEQIDALEIMGINTKAYLIGPKILGSMLTIPLLVVFAMALGILGGRIASILGGSISGEEYDLGLTTRFSGGNVMIGLTKAYIYAFIISSVSAYYGYYVKGGSLEIGRASTSAVIASCILILFADYMVAFFMLN